MYKRIRETVQLGDSISVVRVPGPGEPGFTPITDESIAEALAKYTPPVADPAPVVADEPIDAPPPVSETARDGNAKRTARSSNPSR